VINELAFWLLDLTGMHGVAMSPKAGAHGELCGLLCIRAALEARGDKREVVLVPESAHGTNPATAAFAGYRVESIPANKAGRVDLEALKARLGPDVAAVMITNPNTCGLFEPDMIAISDAVHAAGAFVYCDGANFNAIVGKVRPGDLGIDAMHINLHKTFSTPTAAAGQGPARWSFPKRSRLTARCPSRRRCPTARTSSSRRKARRKCTRRASGG
jgi:glycine dehydrogenase subunit 2